jgi:hypothetical protein
MNEGRGIAGKGARDLADRRYTSRQKYVFLLLLICRALLIFLALVSSHSNLGFGALIVPFIALMLVKAAGRRIDRSVKEERRAVRGAKGEESVEPCSKNSVIAFWFSTTFLRHTETSTIW